MPLTDAHLPGMFCWVELATLDAEAAKTYYEDLFGWTHHEFPMGENPGEVYTIFRHRDRDAGAVYAMMAEQRAQGVPPNWLLYVSVPSVDDAVAKAKTLGGEVLGEPLDVFGMGRMAVLKDPTGAVFAVWQPQSHQGMGITMEPGAFCWGELMTPDTAKAKAFYTALFDWGAGAMTMPDIGEYTVYKVGNVPAGGMLATPPGHEWIPPFWQPYFWVPEVDVTVAKAKAAGSKVFVAPTDVPTVGRVATLADPQGACFAVMTAEVPTT